MTLSLLSHTHWQAMQAAVTSWPVQHPRHSRPNYMVTLDVVTAHWPACNAVKDGVGPTS